MRASDTHWIGSPTAGSSRISVGYAVKHTLQCGFVAYGCRIRTETCPLVRVWHKRASDTHRGVSLSAGSPHARVECALERIPGACSTSLCVICAPRRASGACSAHTRVGYAPKRGAVFLHVVTASIDAALSGSPFPPASRPMAAKTSHTLKEDTPTNHERRRRGCWCTPPVRSGTWSAPPKRGNGRARSTATR